MKTIKFGTSGWRAVISEDFTFGNVRLVTQAIADYLIGTAAKGHGKGEVVVGYDTRFLSKEFAAETADVLSANGIRVLLSKRDVPTPVISFHIIKRHASGGINFTASHNPPQYNGIKFSPSNGGPASPAVTGAIEENIAKLQRQKRRLLRKPRRALIRTFDARLGYFRQIAKLVDLKAISRARLKVGIDCLYGTSRGYLDRLLKEAGCRLDILHDYLNPSFGGRRPEPAPENITELISMVKKKRLDLGLAADGDADRFGIVDSDGTYIGPNEVITLLFYHLLKTRKPGKNVAARTGATTHMIDAIANRHNIEVVETPVGFKYFVDIINSGNCIIAGEESGGLSVSGHLPEKDGILATLLIAEMRAISRRPLKETLGLIYKTYGRLYSDRIDINISDAQKRHVMNRLRARSVKSFAGMKILRRDLSDGCKFYFKNNSWALFRPSGTEPIIRFYFESGSKKILRRLLRAGANTR